MSQYSLCWDSYKNNICNGFSRLQQRQEFVDMTLAAEGHMVKVHQNIIALASPYLKGLIQSASGQHPVIFLNPNNLILFYPADPEGCIVTSYSLNSWTNFDERGPKWKLFNSQVSKDVTHEVLSLILEYIYTGEVRLHMDQMTLFLKAGKALHIAGVEDMIFTKEITTGQKKSYVRSDGHMEPEPFHPRPHLESQPSLKRKMASNANQSTENDYNRETEQKSREDYVNDDVGYINDDVHMKVQTAEPLPSTSQQPTPLSLDLNVSSAPVISVNKNSTLPLNVSNKKLTIIPSIITHNRKIPLLSLHQLQNKNVLTTSSNNLPSLASPVPLNNNVSQNISTLPSSKTEIQNLSTMLLENPLSNLENESISIVPLYNLPSPNPPSTVPLDEESTKPVSHAFSIKVQSSILSQTTEKLPKGNEYSITVNPNLEFAADEHPGAPSYEGDAENTDEREIEKADKISNHLDTLARYSLSNRGALQLVVNRFIYYCHHNSAGGRKRRWRCIDYRRGQCRAFIDSIGDRITNRKYGHTHPFHDKQIIKKMDKNMLFDTVIDAQMKADSRDSELQEKMWSRNSGNDTSDIEVA